MVDEAIVTSVVAATRDSVIVAVQVAEELRAKYRYKQGQNLTFIKRLNGAEVRRSYSICSSVDDSELRVGIKHVENGVFSGWANSQLKVGDKLDVLPPTGNFFVELDPNAQRNFVGVAAGSGITPILSILKTTLETESASHFTLIYGNQSTDTIMFLEEIEALKNRYPQRLQVFHILSREIQNAELLTGRIDGQKIDRFLDLLIDANDIDDVFLCGPFEMVMSAKDAFIDAGVEKKHVHSELFGAPDDLKNLVRKTKQSVSEAEQQHISKVLVMIDGKGTQLNLARSGETVLDAALKIRRDLPFACKGGVCSTCKAKVMEGEVEMDLNYSLSDEEVAAGFILTCQAHPISDRVTIDYDQK
jgi:ring-1,2-phenylacetyl-CoA epoxidase subunit PaaE